MFLQASVLMSLMLAWVMEMYKIALGARVEAIYANREKGLLQVYRELEDHTIQGVEEVITHVFIKSRSLQLPDCNKRNKTKRRFFVDISKTIVLHCFLVTIFLLGTLACMESVVHASTFSY